MMQSPVLGEFAGTMTMLILGDGVVAGCILKGTKAEGAGWMAITTGWAFAVMCGIFVSTLFGSPAAYLNPAILIAAAIQGGVKTALWPLIVAQIAGGIAAGLVVWLAYLPHWAVTDDKMTKLGVFCTAPAIRSYPANLLSEIIATFVFVIVIGATSAQLAVSNTAKLSGPYLVGCLVWSIGLSLGATTGYAINPARDLGPRIAHAILPISGKGGSDWSYAWIPIVGPIIGASAAACLMRFINA